jgi:hypothetical protein
VLSLYTVFEKKRPNHLTILEVYASKAAYQAHLKTTHFLKYKNGTADMAQQLELIDTDPIDSGVENQVVAMVRCTANPPKVYACLHWLVRALGGRPRPVARAPWLRVTRRRVVHKAELPCKASAYRAILGD